MNDVITYREVRKHSLSGNKSATISVLDRVFYRKIAAAITVILINHTNIKPNSVTKISIIFSILGGVILAQSNSIQSYVFAAIMFNTYFLLDVVDGSLSRVLSSRGSFPLTVSDKIGAFYDALALSDSVQGSFASISRCVAACFRHASQYSLWFCSAQPFRAFALLEKLRSDSK